MELLDEVGDSDQSKNIYYSKYTQIKTEWLSFIKIINKSLFIFLDVYFKVLHDVITDKNQNLIYPNN